MLSLRRIGKAARHPREAVRLALQELLFHPAVNRLADRAGGPALAARLALQSIDASDWRRGAGTVLVLDRLYFEKDVVELRRRGRLNYVTLHTHVLSMAQSCWLPVTLQEQISYVPRTTPAHHAAWADAERYASLVLTAARRRWQVGAVLASNVDYWQHESVRRACAEQGVPFLVLCQEQQTVPFTYAAGLKLYRDAGFRYSGTAVAVFEARTRDMLVEAGCCTPGQVVVTGAPRLDPWFDGSVAAATADTITLLSFDGDQYLAPECYLEALAEFAAASIAHRGSELRFLLKCKDAEDEARNARHLAGVPHALEITHTEALTATYPRSRLVMGYNTLAILEALLSPAELAVPQWNDADRPRAEQIVDRHDPACQPHFRFPKSAAAWRALIDEAVATPRPQIDPEARRSLIRRWFHAPASGSASLAVERFIETYLVEGGLPAAARSPATLARVAE